MVDHKNKIEMIKKIEINNHGERDVHGETTTTTTEIMNEIGTEIATETAILTGEIADQTTETILQGT